jgi:hypothetical protein
MTALNSRMSNASARLELLLRQNICVMTQRVN